MTKRNVRVLACVLVAPFACLMIMTPALGQRIPTAAPPPQGLGNFDQGPDVSKPPAPAADTASTLLIPGHSDAPTTQPAIEPTHDVQALIDQLSDDSFNRRQAAVDSLSKLGRDIEPQLRGALAHTASPEVSNSLQTLITQLDKLAQYGPSNITLHANAAPLRGVLESFAKQCSADIVVQGDAAIAQVNQAAITIDLDHASFWDALREINKTCPLTITGNQLQYGQIRGQATLSAVPGTVAGPFLIQPQQTLINRALVYGGQSTPGTITLRLGVTCEPKITVVSTLPVTCTPMENIDDHANTLAPLSSQVQTTNVNNHPAWTLIDSFREQPNIGLHLKSISSTMSVTIQTGHKVVEVADLIHAAGQTRDLGTGTLQVRNVTASNGQYRVDLSCTTPTNQAASVSIANSPAGAAQYFDENGNLLTTRTASLGRSGPNNNVTTWTWSTIVQSTTGTPTTLRYDVTTDSVRIEIPIELHDIDLPS